MLKNLNILENYSIKAIRFITPVFHHSDENLTSCSTCPTKDLVESEISSLSSLSLIFLFRIFFLNLIKFSQFFLSGHDESLHRFFFDFCFDFLNAFFFEKVVINHSYLTHFTKLPLARADDSKRKILIYENTLLFDYHGECTIVLKIKHSSNKIVYILNT